MRIFNEDDVEITQEDVDYDLGHLEQDYRLIKFHEAVPPTGEVGHTRVIVKFTDDTDAVFDNGYPTKYFNDDKEFTPTDEYADKEVSSVDEEYVIDSPYNPGQDAWYENEEILRYILYTEEELAAIESEKQAQQAQQAEEQARREQYQNLLTTVDDITLFAAEQAGTYSEADEHTADLTLAMADLIGGM